MLGIVVTITLTAHLGWIADSLAKIIGCHNMISFYHFVTLITVKCIFYKTSVSQDLITKGLNFGVILAEQLLL